MLSQCSGSGPTRCLPTAPVKGITSQLHTQRHDLAQSFPNGTYDLVTATYTHTPVAISRDHVLTRATQAVAPGGLLIVIEHASTAPWSWQGIHYPAPQDVVSSLQLDDAWHLLRADAPQRTAPGPAGQTAAVTDTVIAVRRLA
ncbi:MULTISPECIES: hypothetical protein [unclassified Kitasatospora]|uniref:hypothetical protein n=1 Tax=unclassified Kitasatospora TaxID=2633591 RepID=UPI0033CE732C